MKSKRRHELKANVLDQELAKGVDFLKKRGSLILWLVIIAALIVLVVVYVTNSRTRRLNGYYAEYEHLKLVQSPSITEAERIERWKRLVDQQDDKRIAAMACVEVADQSYSKIIYSKTPVMPQERTDLLEQAEKYYRRVLSDFPDQKIAVAKANFGLAKLAENAGDLEKAKQGYETILAMAGLDGEPVKTCAEDCLEKLSSLSERVEMATTLPASFKPQTPAEPEDLGELPDMGGGAPEQFGELEDEAAE